MVSCHFLLGALLVCLTVVHSGITGYRQLDNRYYAPALRQNQDVQYNQYNTAPANHIDDVSYIPGVGSCYQYESQQDVQSGPSPPPAMMLITYIQDPIDNCRVYVCSKGKFLSAQSLNCPLDRNSLPGLYEGISPGRPCSQCIGLQSQHQQQYGFVAQSDFETSSPNPPIVLSDQSNLQLQSSSPQQQQLSPAGDNPLVSQAQSQQPLQAGLNSLPVSNSQSPPSVVPPGFVSVISAARINGGFNLFVRATLSQCLSACLMTSYCLAVDYETTSQVCRVHGTGTYCGVVTSFTTSTHYQRVPCSTYSSDLSGTDIKNKAFEIWTNYRVNPLAIGSNPPICSRCRLVDCLSVCYSDVTCQGIDYDASATSCYLLNSTNACISLTPADNTVHISTIRCSSYPGNSITPSSMDGATLYNNFVAVRYMGPTSLPANWLGYPGSRVIGGTPLGYKLTGDSCVALCQLHPSCFSVDFNSANGSCWGHTSELAKCGAPVPTNYIYHVKKTSCDFITGTYRAYPLPVIIGAAQQ